MDAWLLMKTAIIPQTGVGDRLAMIMDRFDDQAAIVVFCATAICNLCAAVRV